MKRACLDCGTPTSGTRCTTCRRTHDRNRRGTTAQRGYGSAWRAYSVERRLEQPWCTDCGVTDDLTTDHGVMGDVVCRRCNSRRRAITGGR